MELNHTAMYLIDPFVRPVTSPAHILLRLLQAPCGVLASRRLLQLNRKGRRDPGRMGSVLAYITIS